MVKDIVAASIAELGKELRAEMKKKESLPSQNETSLLSSTAASMENLGSALPFTLREPQDHESPQPFANDAFTPDIPGQYVKAIQTGEFFDISKLLPHNLNGLKGTNDESLFLAVNNDSTLKVEKRANNKKKISNIEEWTTAFNLFMKIFVDKFPSKASELISYMGLIRYAAFYHQSLGWYLYDQKFRHKVSNDKSLNWGAVDIQLWMMIFTVNQEKLMAEQPLFSD